jgi:hypothetical protein
MRNYQTNKYVHYENPRRSKERSKIINTERIFKDIIKVGDSGLGCNTNYSGASDQEDHVLKSV